MLDVLETHLKTAASPELCVAVTKACEWFEEYELPGYQEEYTNLLLSADNADVGDVNAQINELTLDLQSRILEQLQIFVSSEITVQQGNMILEALRNIEKTEFSDEIIDLCVTEKESDNALCEILALVTGQSAEYFYPLLENVDHSLLVRIKQLCEQDAKLDQLGSIDIEQARQVVDRLTRYKDFITKTPIVYDAVLEGMLIGLPFEQYYAELWEQISGLTPQLKAVELYGASLVSGDAQENPRGIIAAQLNKTYTSADDVTPIVTALEAVILKFHATETSGVKRV